MSDLVYQNYNNKCKGWTNPSNLAFGPKISSLSSYYSPSGSTNLVSISGSYFFSYSSISFGTFNPSVYFINSNTLQFYVPTTLTPGTYTLQVFNGSSASNIVNYTIDNAYSYWLLNSTNNIISNTNTSLVSITSLSRGAPFTIETLEYTVPNNINWFICNFNSIITITLPSGSTSTGREIMFKNISNYEVKSSSTNISDGKTTTSTILPAAETGKPYPWTTLVYNGTNWINMQCNF